MVCTHYFSPIGTLTLVGEGNVLTGLWLERDRPAQLPPEGHAPVFDRAVKWLDGYFQGQPPEISFDLRPAGTPFQKKVWEILLTVPYGQTRTYGYIAKEIDPVGKLSAQAIGGAVGCNPISIIIPCHRIVGAGGKLTGYAGGLEKKAWLLRHEGGIL